MGETAVKTKVCTRCKVEKGWDDFLALSGYPNKRQSQCRQCVNEQTREWRHRHRNYSVSAYNGENEVVQILREIGVYAVVGKQVRAAYVDVMAWGCVTIEVKTAKLSGKRYVFRFSKKQIERDVLSNIIVLICKSDSGNTFHVFTGDDPIFRINGNGRVKHGVIYQIDPKRRRKIQGNVAVTADMMRFHQDAWWLVEQQRLRISEKLKSSKQVVIASPKAA